MSTCCASPPLQGAKLLQHWQSSAAFYEHAVRLISELGAGCHRAALMQLLLSHSLDAKGLLDALSSGAAGQQQGGCPATSLHCVQCCGSLTVAVEGALEYSGGCGMY